MVLTHKSLLALVILASPLRGTLITASQATEGMVICADKREIHAKKVADNYTKIIPLKGAAVFASSGSVSLDDIDTGILLFSFDDYTKKYFSQVPFSPEELDRFARKSASAFQVAAMKEANGRGVLYPVTGRNNYRFICRLSFFYLLHETPTVRTVEYDQVIVGPLQAEVRAQLPPSLELKGPVVFNVGENTEVQLLGRRAGRLFPKLRTDSNVNVLFKSYDVRPATIISGALATIIAETSKYENGVSRTCDCGLIGRTGFKWLR